MTPEEYIKTYTRGCSNELVGGGYHEWLTPENALAAVELAREEMQEPTSEDLEKEIDRYFNTEGIPVTVGALRDTARHFAQWQREQMMKDAIECEVHQTEVEGIELDSVEICSDGLMLNNKKYKAGDKVKVIIIKE